MEAFRECGFPAFIILACALLATVLALSAFAVAFAKPRIGLVIGSIALVLAFVTPVVGVVGTALGKAKVEQALGGGAIDPGVVERIRAQGHAEARQCTSLGAFGSALPLLLSVGATLLSFVRRQTETPAA
jgi:hypothetical protein